MRRLGALFTLIAFLNVAAFAQGPQQMFWALNKCPFLLPQIPADPSGAYSLRKLDCAYSGFAIRVRRSSTGATRDIGFLSDGTLDTVSLKSFIGTADGTIAIWYDQSGNGRNATQSTVANQPTIVSSGVLVTSSVSKSPALLFSGSQWLDCGTNTQTMTNSGAEGSVFMVLTASTNSQTQFGAVSTSGSLPSPDRWATHVNWIDNNLYFDAGNCCSSPNNRVVGANGANVNVWRQYSLIRESTVSSIRISGSTLATTSGFPSTVRCTVTANFWIGAPNGYSVNSMTPMTGRLSEFIIYPAGITGSARNAIESNQMTYFNL